MSRAVDTESTEPDPLETIRKRLRWLREGPRSDLVTFVTFLLALPLGLVHWVGLLLGGVVVGLLAPSLRRAGVLAAYLGGVWTVLFVGWLWVAGVLGRAAATGELFGLSVAMAVVLPILGASIRGLG